MRNTHHTFSLHIDLRDEELTNENLNEVVAKLLLDAAERIARGDRIGGFHAPQKGHSFDGGFAFYDGIVDRPTSPSVKETQLIISAIGARELTRENKVEWRQNNLTFATESQFDSVFDPAIVVMQGAPE